MLLKTASLTPKQLNIIQDKGTEAPFSCSDEKNAGTYLCRQCGLALYRSSTKFSSQCGWPSFDEEIPNAVKHSLDADGQRIEILCQRCTAHLGHVFQGEGFTSKNTRHCVNGVSMDFVADTTVQDSEEAIFAAGCFWGVEFYFKKLTGVLKTEVGYSGGSFLNPSYEDICRGTTGHYEVIRVLYDPKKISYPDVVKYFFEIHDPTQLNGQGPDIGHQYLSVIFYYNDAQKNYALQLIHELKSHGFNIATQVKPVVTFWHAEAYHQDYYDKHHKAPYCHQYVKRF